MLQFGTTPDITYLKENTLAISKNTLKNQCFLTKAIQSMVRQDLDSDNPKGYDSMSAAKANPEMPFSRHAPSPVSTT